MSHKHFSIKERESIAWFLAKNKSIAFIANKLGRHRSSIYREINRNIVDGHYSPFDAQTLTKKRKLNCGRNSKLKNSILLIYIQEKLELGWSPEQIAGRAKINGLYNISFKTIYRAIYLNFLIGSDNRKL